MDQNARRVNAGNTTEYAGSRKSSKYSCLSFGKVSLCHKLFKFHSTQWEENSTFRCSDRSFSSETFFARVIVIFPYLPIFVHDDENCSLRFSLYYPFHETLIGKKIKILRAKEVETNDRILDPFN